MRRAASRLGSSFTSSLATNGGGPLNQIDVLLIITSLSKGQAEKVLGQLAPVTAAQALATVVLGDIPQRGASWYATHVTEMRRVYD